MNKLFLSVAFAAAASVSQAADLLVTPDSLKASLNDPKLVLFHVGPKPDFDKEHIPGARLIAGADLAFPRAEGALILQLLPPDALRARGATGNGLGNTPRCASALAYLGSARGPALSRNPCPQ